MLTVEIESMEKIGAFLPRAQLSKLGQVVAWNNSTKVCVPWLLLLQCIVIVCFFTPWSHKQSLQDTYLYVSKLRAFIPDKFYTPLVVSCALKVLHLHQKRWWICACYRNSTGIDVNIKPLQQLILQE